LEQTRQRDSARIIRDFIRGYKPKPIIEYRDKIEWRLDSAAMNQVYAKLRGCEQYQRDLEHDLRKAGPWKLRFWIAVAVGVLFIVLLIIYLINRLTKIRKLTARPPIVKPSNTT
jgi:hypothetical protein